MEKKNVKKIDIKIVGIVAVVIIILAVSGIFYAKNKATKVALSAPVVATVRKASFSSVVNVTLSDAGKKQYPGTTKYQVYYNGKPIAQKIAIGKPTTAFPARKVNDKVEVKLIRADGKVAYSVNLGLQKADALK